VIPTPVKWPGNVRVKMVRDYSAGSLRDQIFKATNYEQLQEVRGYIRAVGAGMSPKTRRRLEAVIRRQELVLPNEPRLLVPPGADKLIVRP